MKWIHTADWHIGRSLFGVNLIDDQAHLLEQLIGILKDRKPDLLIVAGDIYDRSIPPEDAVILLDRVFSQILQETQVAILVISGNHDSSARLGFGSALLTSRGFHLVCNLKQSLSPIVIEDETGPVHFFALPYSEPSLIREFTGNQQVRDHDSAFEAMLPLFHNACPVSARKILAAHAFVAGAATSDSERPLSIGGAGTVSTERFIGFNYVALGHLHRAQNLGSEKVQYSGSLFNYSASEIDQEKSVTWVEMNASGEIHSARIPLAPRRQLRKMKGELKDLLEQGQVALSAGDLKRHDYILAELTDRGALFDPMGKLRLFYPNILHTDRAEQPRAPSGSVQDSALAKNLRSSVKQSEFELFSSFFKEVTGEETRAEEKAVFEEILSSWQKSQNDPTAHPLSGPDHKDPKRTNESNENIA